jgi:hypothetical protein
MHIKPTGNVRITFKDLAEKPEKYTPLNTQNIFRCIYIHVYFIFIRCERLRTHSLQT